MNEMLKDIIENYEKLHRLQMIETILDKMHSYVRDVASRVEDYFDENDDFEDYISDNIVKNIQNDIEILKRYLN